MLKSIEIIGLFDLFNYTIELTDNGITILTGPNGFGKTTILRIIYELSNQNPMFFLNLLFHEIILHATEGDQVHVKKTSENDIEFHCNNNAPVKISKTTIIGNLENLTKDTPFRKFDEEHWLDLRTEQVINTEILVKKFMPDLPKIYNVNLITTPAFYNVYLIREQRLLRRVTFKNRAKRLYYNDNDFPEIFSETIEEYAKELKESIKDTLAKSTQISQELDSSFPRRLFDEKHQISENEFNTRFNKVKEIQKSLNNYKLSIAREDNHPTYKSENAKALLVYIHDVEEKLVVFSDLLKKLDLFTEILNKRRFTFKQINVNKDCGFEFVTDTGRPINLTDLSSGEQQEVILLYELLFRVTSGTLVLIDEPEISLHVAWQKEFLNDLLKVTEMKGIKVIIATHSPQIINDRWDLTVDLEEIRK